MNREIKFKFWDKDLKKMCERKPAHNDFNHKNIIPLQFTGFNSGDGSEIYEGDVLKVNNSDYSYRVVFENGAFYLYHSKEDWGKWGLLSRIYDADMKKLVDLIIITGNIYTS